jgi:uncharacterized membrane protein
MKKATFKRYLIAGLLVLAPLWVTFALLEYLIRRFDKIMNLLPPAYQPDVFLGFHLPGLGLLVVLCVVCLTGMLATNFIGRYVIDWWESILARIPLVRTIYAGVKQILDTMFSPGGKSFRKVVLVEYPRAGSWTMAFQTSNAVDEANQKTGQDLVSVYVLTTPNPTSGYLLLLPRKDVIEMNISVDEALKLIISLGVIMPKTQSEVVVKK